VLFIPTIGKITSFPYRRETDSLLEACKMKKRASSILILLILASLFGACRADNRSFRRIAGPDLPGTEWTLTSLNGSSLIEDTEITLFFREAYLGGTMTCNNYGGGSSSGKYMATDDGTIAILQLAVTVQLCSEPEGITEQEAAYIEALHEATTYQVTGDRLEIADDRDGIRLVFALVAD
jgi:heat shock protein HslJ